MKHTYHIHNYKISIYEETNRQIQAICITDNISYQIFECDNVKLQKINLNTILNAFDKKSPNIKYELIHRQQKIIIQIIVWLQFLPKISQVITLNRIHQQNGFHMKEIKYQLNQLQQYLSKIKANRVRMIQRQTIYLSQTQYWSQLVMAGKHLIQISGNVLHQQYYQEQDYMNQIVNYSQIQFILSFSQNNEIKHKQSFPIQLSHNSGYDMPFKINAIFQNSKQNTIQLKTSFIKQQIVINSFLVTITQIS